MIRSRVNLLVLVTWLALFGTARSAWAAAEVHRLNVVISGIPTLLDAKDFNERIDDFNRFNLEPFGFEGLTKIHFAWLFDSQLRYFVRQNVVVEAGVGQLRSQTKREFLPALNADIQLRSEILSVPAHIGGAYYLQPYNQGDFRAQVYLGGGFISSVYNRVRIQTVVATPDTVFSGQVTGKGDSPGYYLESGLHMFFAARFSVLVSAYYRSAVIRDMRGVFSNGAQEFQVGRLADRPRNFPLGGLKQLDAGGIGARMAVGIGL